MALANALQTWLRTKRCCLRATGRCAMCSTSSAAFARRGSSLGRNLPAASRFSRQIATQTERRPAFGEIVGLAEAAIERKRLERLKARPVERTSLERPIRSAIETSAVEGAAGGGFFRSARRLSAPR